MSGKTSRRRTRVMLGDADGGSGHWRNECPCRYECKCDDASERNGRTKRSGITNPLSWWSLLISVLLRIAIGAVLIIIAVERTTAYFSDDDFKVGTRTLIWSVWTIAVLSIASGIFALIGILSDENL